MAFNPFLDDIYNEHWTNYQDAYGGMDPNSFHGGGDESWLVAQEQPANPWTNPDTGTVQGYSTGGAAANVNLDNIPAEYKQWADEAGAEFGVDPKLLLALAATESNFNPRAVSPAGAIGLMQFMPGTAQQYGVDPNDPKSSLFGAARYLSDLNKMKGIDGDWSKTLAAYNAGPGRVLDGRWTRIPETVGHNQKTWANYEKLAGGGQSQRGQGQSWDGPQGNPGDWGFVQGAHNRVDLAGVTPEARQALYNTHQAWTQQGNQGRVSLNSAYRSPEYNEKLRQASMARNGGKSGVAKNSRHMQGDAFDVSVRGWNNQQQQQFLDAARANGFTGFGFYPSEQFIHMDQGPAREWGNKARMNLSQLQQLQQPQSPLQGAAGLPVDPVQPYLKMIEEGLYS